MPKDQDKIEGRAKNTPAFVQIAQQALADVRVQGHADYAVLKKALPTYAAKLNQKGEDVTVDHLIEQALQGADHIKSMSDSVTTKRALTYDAVVVHLPKPQEPDLSLEEQLFKAAMIGDLKQVQHLESEGINIHADNDIALRFAAKYGHLDVVKYLVDQDANIHANNDEALCWAAANGHLGVVKHLIAKGAKVDADNDFALRAAAYHGHLDVVKYLVNKGANQERLSEDQQNQLSGYNLWLDTFGECPTGCHTFDPTLFTDLGVQNCFQMITDALQSHEGYKDNKGHANQIAFKAAVLFRDPHVVLKYLRKWGEAGKQPLHNVIQMIDLPKKGLENVDLQSWQSAVMFHGSKMAKLFKFADKVTPQKSAEGKNWLYHETLKEVAKHAYPKAQQNPNLSALFMEHVMGEGAFDTALDLTKKYTKQYGTVDADKNGMIPDVSFTLPNGMTYKKLTDGDYTGMVLGEITDCCQSIGGDGHKCAKHGYLSKDSGFYVLLDKKGKIIGQSWAWIGKKNELVLDSLESLTGRVTTQDWQDVMAEFKTALNDNAKDITALHIGTGGKTPSLSYERKAATPKDYNGYRDSYQQYRVWKR